MSAWSDICAKTLMRETLSRLWTQKSSLWLVLLAALLFVPLMFSVFLATIAFELLITSPGTNPIGLFVLSGAFFMVFLFCATYVHALFVSASVRVQKKQFSFISAFSYARSLFWKCFSLGALVLLPLGGLLAFAFVLPAFWGWIVVALSALWVVLCVLALLNVNAIFTKNTFFSALKHSLSGLKSSDRYLHFAQILGGAVFVTVVYALLTYKQVAGQALIFQLGFFFIYLLFTLASVLVPGLAITNSFLYVDYGALSGYHLLITLPLQILFVFVMINYLFEQSS